MGSQIHTGAIETAGGIVDLAGATSFMSDVYATTD
jgi:hypothetical protein